MKKGKLQRIARIAAMALCIIFAVSLFSTSVLAADYKHPNGLWKHYDRWNEAVKNKDYKTILELAPVIEALYKGEELNKDNSGMLTLVCEQAAIGCELKGDLEGAVNWFKKELVYDEYIHNNVHDWSDRITLTKALIRQLDVKTDIYTVASNPSDVPYFGALGEPKVGTLQGSVCHRDASKSIQSGESAILIYVEFEPNSSYSMQYWVEYYTKNEKGQKALAGDSVIELAWNFPKEAGQLSDILNGNNDSYIIDSLKYLGTLNTKILLRIGAEMNVWTNLPDGQQYRDSFKKIAGYARQYTKNVALVFSPGDVSTWGKNYTDYYPGDEYVDWIGVSTYYRGEGAKNNRAADAFYGTGDYSASILPMLRLLTETFPKKPMIISECGFAYYTTTNGDQTAAAIDRMKKFYSFLTIQYPQIKAVLYFDNELPEEKYRYSLSGSAQLKTEYLNIVKQDTFLSSSKGSAKGYTRLSNVNEKMDVIKLYTNALFPRLDKTTCAYYLDGKLVKTTSEVPYSLELQVKDLSAGEHTIKVDVTCGSIKRTVERQIRVSANGIVTGKDKWGTAPPTQPKTPSLVAKPTASDVLVNGKKVSFNAYSINDSNYFQLRDLAFVLNGSGKQFEVGWDGVKNTISLTSGNPYTVTGSEMSGKATGEKLPVPSDAKIYLDGKEISLTAYNIDGSNYFKLRDIGQALGFYVDWDNAKNTIVIDTEKAK